MTILWCDVQPHAVWQSKNNSDSVHFNLNHVFKKSIYVCFWIQENFFGFLPDGYSFNILCLSVFFFFYCMVDPIAKAIRVFSIFFSC